MGHFEVTQQKHQRGRTVKRVFTYYVSAGSHEVSCCKKEIKMYRVTISVILRQQPLGYRCQGNELSVLSNQRLALILYQSNYDRITLLNIVSLIRKILIVLLVDVMSRQRATHHHEIPLCTKKCC